MIKGFKMRKPDEEMDLTKAPLVLTDAKKDLKTEIEENLKEIKEPAKLNIYEQLM